MGSIAVQAIFVIVPEKKTSASGKNDLHRPDVEFLCKIIVFFISVIFFSPASGSIGIAAYGMQVSAAGYACVIRKKNYE